MEHSENAEKFYENKYIGEELKQIFASVTKPILPKSPCGKDIEYDENDDTYFRISNEMGKRMSGTSDINWDSIIKNSIKLLSTKTKDLQLVYFLMVALVKNKGYAGLFTGLKTLEYYLDHFWEGLFPSVEKIERRKSIIESIDEVASLYLPKDATKNTEDASLVKECLSLTDEMSKKVQEKISSKEDLSLSYYFKNIRHKISSYWETLSISKRKSDSPPTASAESPLQKVTSTKNMGPVDIPSKIGSINEGLKAVIKVVKLILAVAPDASVAQRLGRVAMWGDLNKDSLPKHENGKTNIDLQRQKDLERCQMLCKKGNWTELLILAENIFWDTGKFNLNLQRFIFLALQGNGKTEAANVVQRETGNFLLKFPELVDLSYKTGEPFANELTRAWCEEAKALVSPMTNGANAAGDTSWEDDAKKLEEEKNFDAALEYIQQAISQATVLRKKLHMQVFAAKLCFRHGHAHWAIPIMEAVEQRITEMNLVQWEPEFCSDVWSNLLRMYGKISEQQKVDNIELARRNQIRSKLFDIDLAGAISVTSK